MKFENGTAFRHWNKKALTLFGMSGAGKTVIANRLRAQDWYHYSVDYRIGTRYMGEHISDNYKRIAMTVPFFRDLLKSDSIYISSNITFQNLAPLSTYLGKPGDETRGGLPFCQYLHRQRQHRRAEINALLDTEDFITNARTTYGYDHFVCDTGGSFCEVVDVDDPSDPVLRSLCDNTVLVYIRSDQAQTDALIERFRRAPKPMYYNEAFLHQTWARFKDVNAIAGDQDVDPDAFAIYGFKALIDHRLPLYEAIAERYGYVVDAARLAEAESAATIIDVCAQVIDEASKPGVTASEPA